ncbi:VTT domain-containing protein [Aneurinibacillus terranovensis]|uniref:TVP38/TMEM64 family protein n=1 Tax=Aneurinibacillus terranovensis TaxID=278991 RepID=UPI000684C511
MRRDKLARFYRLSNEMGDFVKKGWTVVLYTVIIILVYFYRHELLTWMKGSALTNIPLMMVIATFFALFPIVPYGMIIAIMGWKFGVWNGALISWAGALTAALLMFLFVRYIFADRGRQYLAKFTLTDNVTTMIEKKPFLAILIARLIPVIPQAAVNVYISISRIRFISYAAASAAGKIPGMIVFAFIGAQATAHVQSVFVILAVYAVFLSVVYGLYRCLVKIKWLE